MSNRLRIAIIGPGRVGRALAMGWKNVGHTIVATTSSSKAQVRDALSWQLPNTPMVAADELPDADLVAVTTPDDAVGPVVDSLAKLGRWRPGQIVLHASGSHGLDVLDRHLVGHLRLGGGRQGGLGRDLRARLDAQRRLPAYADRRHPEHPGA